MYTEYVNSNRSINASFAMHMYYVFAFVID